MSGYNKNVLNLTMQSKHTTLYESAGWCRKSKLEVHTFRLLLFLFLHACICAWLCVSVRVCVRVCVYGGRKSMCLRASLKQSENSIRWSSRRWKNDVKKANLYLPADRYPWLDSYTVIICLSCVAWGPPCLLPKPTVPMNQTQPY